MLKMVAHCKLIVVQSLGLESYKMVKNQINPPFFLLVKQAFWAQIRLRLLYLS